MSNEETFITLVMDFGDEGNTEVNLTREEYDTIVWNAGRANMNIEEYFNMAIQHQIEELKKEDTDNQEN